MANNYSQFSESLVELTEAEITWIKDFLTEEAPDPDEEKEAYQRWCEERHLQEGDEPEWFPGFQWQVEENSLWMYSEEGCNTDYLVVFIQKFLQKFRPEEVFTATGADFCSKLRVSEFGGWWIAVSANYVRSGNCHGAAEKAKKQLLERIKKEKG